MLGDTELQQVQTIDVDGDQVLLRHSIPALEGDFLQRLNRRASRIRLSGVLTGATARDDLKTLRDKYRAGDPVSFVADIGTATRIGEVLIQALNIRELAGKPERFEYGFLLREYQPPPPPPTPVTPEPPEPPTTPITQQVGNLIIEVIVEGQPNYDFSRIAVSVQKIKQDGTRLPRRTLSNRIDNVWTENDFPVGSYSTEAVATEDGMSGTEAAEVRPGETERVTIILRPGTTVAHAFIVHFTFDRAFIEPCLMRVLKRVADYAQSHGDEKLLIVGHTDEVGRQSYNISLGDRRARTVYAALTYGAVADAAVDEWNEIRRPRPAGETPSIHEGRGGWGVVEYQHMLQDLGFYPGNVDGQAGPLTDHAITTFQQAHTADGLTVNGIVDDTTWRVLIKAYLEHYNLNTPPTQFLPNCEGEILKWLSCGERMPLPTTPRPCNSPAWRPNRRTELLFTTANALPCPIPRPVTFDLPPPDGVGGGWCIGPGDPDNPCCFVTRDSSEHNKWLIQPAEPGTLSLSGRMRFEDGTPAANIPYVLTTPDGEYLHKGAGGQPDDGEIICGSNNKGTPNPVHNRTDANGVFDYPRQTPVGVYTLEIKAAYVARLESQSLEDARGNIVCKHLQPGNPFDVVIVDLAVTSVRPNISATRTLVIVQKPHTNPARVTITLRTNSAFTGFGTFTRSDDHIRFFTAPTGGNEVIFDGTDNVFTSAQLSAGHDVYAEGARHSDTMDDVVLTLALTVSGQPGFTDQLNMTAVELTLDISEERAAPGVDPAPLPQPPATPPAAGTTPTDKWYGGRLIQVRYPSTTNNLRALLMVREVQPNGFSDDLILRQVAITRNNVTGLANRAQLHQNETPPTPPATEPAPHPNPLIFNASTVPAIGRRFWIDGRTESTTFRDTGYQLGIDSQESDGDRIATTVITLALTNNTAPFDSEIERVQIEGVLNRDRTSYDIGDLFNNQADSLFRARAEIPGVTGNTVLAQLVSTNTNGTTLETHDISLTNTSGNQFISLPILAIPEAIPRTDITFRTAQNIEIIRCVTRGRLRLEFRGIFSSRVNYEVRVRGRILEFCTVTIQGASPNINTYVNTANRVMAQYGIEIRNSPQPNINNPALLDINQTDCPLTIGGDNHRGTEEQTLFNLGRATCPANFIVYFVQSIPGLRGCSAYPVGQPGVIVADTATQYTFAHEIGHVLHLPHTNAANNLMRRTTSTLPNNPANINLLPNQCQLMDNSGFLVFRE